MPEANHQRTIFHLDADAFYASIEQRDHPEWRGKPVIIGTLASKRGVVSTASYEARKFGVRSAMPIALAYQACPQGIFVAPRMQQYAYVSRQLMDILSTYTPLIEPLSIDEAFMDMTGTEKLWGAPKDVARTIQQHIFKMLQITVSIGIAPNKFLAKFASDLQKPCGLTVTPTHANAIATWLAPYPVGKLWGVGKVTEKLCIDRGIHTIGDVQKLSNHTLKTLLGVHGERLYFLCRGEDDRGVEKTSDVQSISRERTFESDCADPSIWRKTLRYLSLKVAKEARKEGLHGKTAFIVYRNPTFDRHTLQIQLPIASASAKSIFDAAWQLMSEEFLIPRPIRLLGVGLHNLTSEKQLDLWQKDEDKQEKVEGTLDLLSKKYGSTKVFFGDQKTP